MPNPLIFDETLLLEIYADIEGRIPKEYTLGMERTSKAGSESFGMDRKEIDQTLWIPKRMEYLDMIVEKFKLHKHLNEKLDPNKKIVSFTFNALRFDERTGLGIAITSSNDNCTFHASRTSYRRAFLCDFQQEEGLFLGCISPASIPDSRFRAILVSAKDSIIRIADGRDKKTCDKLFSTLIDGRPRTLMDRLAIWRK